MKDNKTNRVCFACSGRGKRIHSNKPCTICKGSGILPEDVETNANISINNPVDHPNHYTQGKIEVIDFIVDQKFDYIEGNIIKYISRYKYKNGLEDLKKAKFYLERLIKIKEGSV